MHFDIYIYLFTMFLYLNNLHKKKKIIQRAICDFPHICIDCNAGQFHYLYFHGMCLEETHVTMISSFYKEIQQAKSDLRLSVLAKRKITFKSRYLCLQCNNYSHCPSNILRENFISYYTNLFQILPRMRRITTHITH